MLAGTRTRDGIRHPAFPQGWDRTKVASEPMRIHPAPSPPSAAEARLLRRYDSEPCDVTSTKGNSVTSRHSPTDERIIRQLERLSEADGDYWTFRRRAARRQTHGLTQYPAMMVPAMQAELIRVIADADGRVTKVLDPFVGSGTTLVECMRLGLNFAGQDTNPLAVLFCRTKAGPFHADRLESAVKDVVERASSDRGKSVESEFPGLDKWFCPVAVTELSRIRRAIRRVDDTWCRRALWTGLAETVRLTSNSRTSTFKLHIRSSDELRSREVHPVATFATIAVDIIRRLQLEATTLQESGYLSVDGRYRGDVNIHLGDSTKMIPAGRDRHDLLFTSPPYGDNTSTVPYGQYSYLPLQWIDLHDIDENADSRCLRSTYEIDRRSLGGSRKNAVQEVQQLLNQSPSLEETLRQLEVLPADRAGRVAAFCRDLDCSLRAVLRVLRPSAYMIWTVGNRCVGGRPVPTDAILKELLAAKGVHLVTRIERKIPNKRMATRNSIAKTMRGEAILVFRKV